MASAEPSGETLPGPDELSAEERAVVEAALFALADDEFVIAERYTEWQVRSPTLESDLALSNVAQDELGHARLWYDLLMDFGYTEADLLFERDPAEWRHATLVELPFEEGDWADAIVRGYFYDVFEDLELEAFADSTYPRIEDRVGKVRSEEEYHLQHARNWLERLCDDDPGRERVQDAVDRLFPYALTLFEPTDREDEIVDLGVRPRSLSDMREEWFDVVVPFLESLGVRTPIGADGEVDVEGLLPEKRGRDGEHTDDWPDLFEEFTHTYRELDRSEAHRIMGDPDDVE